MNGQWQVLLLLLLLEIFALNAIREKPDLAENKIWLEKHVRLANAPNPVHFAQAHPCASASSASSLILLCILSVKLICVW